VLGGLGTTELVIIMVIVLCLFGAGKLPMVFKQMARGLREFRETLAGKDEESEDEEKKLSK